MSLNVFIKPVATQQPVTGAMEQVLRARYSDPGTEFDAGPFGVKDWDLGYLHGMRDLAEMSHLEGIKEAVDRLLEMCTGGAPGIEVSFR